MKEKNVFLCIHGHFYQPPRENPWLEEIELQESAAPSHDWNEKIFYECYLPNAMARVLDDKGKILDIVNNYEKISFNFWPTLLSWIHAKHPVTYQHLLEADRRSRSARRGHGNAIAQVYNHMILPLAKRRDKITQVRWGIADFRFRFGRDPESVWLPETACNDETLEVLLEEKMKFVILEPHQAEAVRALDQNEWQDVSEGTIDPKMPYRWFSKADPSRFIDTFFFDGPISKSVGFGDLAFEAKYFAERLESAKVERYDGPQLIHVATDGETYGHHKAFGERALAFLLHREAPKRGFHLVNYGEFLENHPPRFAVRLKPGPDGEGTSWSCAHGVRRWRDHCGCRTGGPAEWTQHWRKPLKESLDWLGERLAEIYEEMGRRYFKDVWEARNDYIRIILDRCEKNVTDFFKRHASRRLERAEMVPGLKLLEMERNAMLTYTSCGWFFNEISGIETVQVLQYAARAIQLARELTQKSLEEEFLGRLEKARSNVAEFKDGRGVYEKGVRPRMATLEHLVSCYAICSLVEGAGKAPVNQRLYGFDLNVLREKKKAFGSGAAAFGRVRVVSSLTLEENDLIFAAVQSGLYDFRCWVKPFGGPEELERLEKGLKIEEVFGPVFFTLKDLPLHERRKVISVLTKEIAQKVSADYEHLYDENLKLNEIYHSINLPIPPEVRYAAEHTLSKRLQSAVRELAAHGFNLKKAAAVSRILEAAKSFDGVLKKEEVGAFLSSEFMKRVQVLSVAGDPERVAECLNIHKLAKKIGVTLNESAAQVALFFLVKQWTENPGGLSEAVRNSGPGLLQLLNDLQINAEKLKKEIT